MRTKEQIEQGRKEFEEALVSLTNTPKEVLQFISDPNLSTGIYKDSDTQQRWEGWNMALDHVERQGNGTARHYLRRKDNGTFFCLQNTKDLYVPKTGYHHSTLWAYSILSAGARLSVETVYNSIVEDGDDPDFRTKYPIEDFEVVRVPEPRFEKKQ